LDTPERSEIRGEFPNMMLEKVTCSDRMRNEDVLHCVNEERNKLGTVKRRDDNWIGHNLCSNCLLKHIIEGTIEIRIEVTGWRGRKSKQLLDDLKGKSENCKLKEEALDRTLWRTRYGRGCGTVVRQAAE
jgi:hypothetical protein